MTNEEIQDIIETTIALACVGAMALLLMCM